MNVCCVGAPDPIYAIFILLHYTTRNGQKNIGNDNSKGKKNSDPFSPFRYFYFYLCEIFHHFGVGICLSAEECKADTSIFVIILYYLPFISFYARSVHSTQNWHTHGKSKAQHFRGQNNENNDFRHIHSRRKNVRYEIECHSIQWMDHQKWKSPIKRWCNCYSSEQFRRKNFTRMLSMFGFPLWNVVNAYMPTRLCTVTARTLSLCAETMRINSKIVNVVLRQFNDKNLWWFVCYRRYAKDSIQRSAVHGIERATTF